MYKYACEFTITGMGDIPMDMFRYDRCTPLTQQDVAQFSALEMVDNPIDIRMVRFTRRKSDGPTINRWKSFGWNISNITFRKLY